MSASAHNPIIAIYRRPIQWIHQIHGIPLQSAGHNKMPSAAVPFPVDDDWPARVHLCLDNGLG